jgi:hypothetical protein
MSTRGRVANLKLAGERSGCPSSTHSCLLPPLLAAAALRDRSVQWTAVLQLPVPSSWHQHRILSTADPFGRLGSAEAKPEEREGRTKAENNKGKHERADQQSKWSTWRGSKSDMQLLILARHAVMQHDRSPCPYNANERLFECAEPVAPGSESHVTDIEWSMHTQSWVESRKRHKQTHIRNNNPQINIDNGMNDAQNSGTMLWRLDCEARFQRRAFETRCG